MVEIVEKSRVVELSLSSQYGRKPKTSRLRPLGLITAAGWKTDPEASSSLLELQDAGSAGMTSPGSTTGWSTGVIGGRRLG